MPVILVDPYSAVFLICFLVGVIFVVASALMGITTDLAHFPGLHHGHIGGVSNGQGTAGHGADGAGHASDVGHGHVGASDFGHGHAGATDLGHGHAGGAHVGHAPGGADSAAAHPGGHADSVRQTVTASPFNLMTLMAFLAWFGGTGYVLYSVYEIFLPLSILGAFAAGALAGWLVYLFLAKVLLPGTVAGDLEGQTLVGTTATVSVPISEGRLGEIVYTLQGARHSDGARSVNGTDIGHEKEVVIVRYERGIAYVQEWESYRDELEGMPDSQSLPPDRDDGKPSTTQAD